MGREGSAREKPGPDIEDGPVAGRAGATAREGPAPVATVGGLGKCRLVSAHTTRGARSAAIAAAQQGEPRGRPGVRREHERNVGISARPGKGQERAVVRGQAGRLRLDFDD